VAALTAALFTVVQILPVAEAMVNTQFVGALPIPLSAVALSTAFICVAVQWASTYTPAKATKEIAEGWRFQAHLIQPTAALTLAGCLTVLPWPLLSPSQASLVALGAQIAVATALILWGAFARNERRTTDGIVSSGLGYLAWTVLFLPNTMSKAPDPGIWPFIVAASWTLTAVALVVLREKASDWEQGLFAVVGGLVFLSAFMGFIPSQLGFAVTLALSLYGLILLVAGFRLNLQTVRWFSYGVFGLAGCKVFFVDIAGLDPGPRVLAFLAAGTVLLLSGLAAVYLWKGKDKAASTSPRPGGDAEDDLGAH
jgi:hypothetical protein